MNKKRICIVCVIVIFAITTGYLFEKKSKEEISMEPDGVSSISMNRDQYLTVVANRDRIEDKEEFAKLLVKMCRENSFHTIKFSTDRGYATGIHMQIETMILMMRELRYDVRTTNTHPTIRTDEIICTYPFPMLSERVMFEKSKGVNYD